MRRTLLGIAMLAFVTACSDAPTAPSELALSPERSPSFLRVDNPPPPWAVISGEIADANNVAYTFLAHLLINKPGNVAWMSFQNGGTAVFSPNARIMSANGTVIGVGTMKLGGTTYQLSSIQAFDADRACTNSVGFRSEGPTCATFGGEGFSSSYSYWTGQSANNKTGFGKPGDGGGDEYCTIISDYCYTTGR